MKKEILKSRILIVEDDVIGRATLAQIFKKNGFINIEIAEDGKEGFEKIISFKPQLVISDIQMPKMNGFDLCKAVRNHPDSEISNTPILVESALTDSKDKAEIFSCGASDYISKPIDALELMARSKVHLHSELATRNLREFSARVSQELEIAKETQIVLIPSKEEILDIEKSYNVNISEHFQTCSELGGDFWGVKPISNDCFSVFTVDFSGHGVNAALNVFRMHAIMQTFVENISSPSDYLTNLNAMIAPIIPRGTFATMFYCVVDTKNNQLYYSAAASPPPIIFRQNGTSETLETTGMLLGALPNSMYKTSSVSFNKGDCLLLYSDALTETMDLFEQTLSVDDVIKKFGNELNNTQSSCKKSLENFIDFFNKKNSLGISDDLTIVAVHRKQ